MAKKSVIKKGTLNKSARYDELVKCGSDPKYFIKKYIKISHPTKGLVKFELYPFQEDCLDAFINHEKIVINKSRQLGLSTVAAAYSLWMALFHRERNVLVIATKLEVAKNFIRKVKANLDGLPEWLVLPTMTAQSVKYLQFSNGSQIKAIPTSADAGRSEAISLLIVDECAHVEGIDELWLGLQPTLSCVAGDTLILTDNGFIEIEEYHKNKNIGDYFDLRIPVYGKNGMELTSKGYVSPENETIIVKTKHGHKVEVTPIHPLYTLQNNGVGKMIQTQNLKLGDHLRIEVGQNCFGKTTLKPDLAYMIGGYIAEGWITKRKNKKTGVVKYDSIEIENCDHDFRDVYLKSESLKKNFIIVPSRDTRLRCSSRELINEFISYGINPQAYCYNKQTPQSILQGDKQTVTNYLSGLFDGDGCVSKRAITLSSTSEKLIRQTNVLLHNLGFISNVSHVPARAKEIGRIMPQGKPLQSVRESWIVCIPRSQYLKFYNEIGFRIKRKNNHLLQLSKTYKQDDRKLFTIPMNKVGEKISSLLKNSGKTKKWFREEGLRLDKCLDKRSSERFINPIWLIKFHDLLAKASYQFTTEDQIMFDENIGSFYWDEIVSMEKSYNKTYDFTVPKTHSFLQNGILGSNTGGSAILISSPAGVGNLFHRIWVDSRTDQNEKKEGKNGFYPIELPWTVHPERDIKWFEKQRAEIITAAGERGVGMELLCSFASSGDTFIKGDALDELLRCSEPPVNIQAHGRDEVWLWEPPIEGHKYVIGADVSRGDSDDYSAFVIIDTLTNNIVGDFKGKTPPDKFADMLVQYGTIYNMAMICQELNAVGAACATQLKSSKYPNLFYEKFMKNIYMTFVNQDVGDSFPGYTVGPNTRIEILAKLENLMRNGKIHSKSKRLFEELQTFIWKGNKPQAQKGYNDDLTMALALACNIYEPDNTNPVGDVDFAVAMLKGMSRQSRTLDPFTGNQQNHQVDKQNTGDGLWKVPEKFNDLQGQVEYQKRLSSLGKSGTQNYNDSRWKMWRWMFDD